MSIWVSDFETTTDENDCRVWAWAVCDIDRFKVEMNVDIDSFISWCTARNSVVYFHNLAFDGSFIIDYLFRHGFSHTTDRPRRNEFSTLISDMGKFYSMMVVWEDGTRTEFRDSLKKLPMSVANVAKTFGLEESKGSIDYEAYRAPGHELTEEEKDYIARDVIIVAKALKQQIDEGMKKLTVGSDSLAEFKRLTGKKHFSRLFPILPLNVDSDIRKAYRGGWTYADSRFRGKIVGEGRAYDVNSLYPYVMRTKVLPYGEPSFTNTWPKITKEYPLFIASVTVTAKLRKDHLPCIQIKGSRFFVGTEYQTEIKEPTTIFCTNIDLELWRKHYELDILSFNGVWRFHGTIGIFNEYVDKWSEIKASSKGGRRAIAKLHLNSLYGKFATNPVVQSKIPVMQDDKVALVLGEEEERSPVYTPMGVFITAYAREHTIRHAQLNYPRFLYADTDSLHLLGDYPTKGMAIGDTLLGFWAHEYDFKRALFARAKAYTVERASGEVVTHIAGLPDKVAKLVTFDDYFTGKVFEGKLQPKRVKGGIVLHDVGFTLKKLI